AVPINVFCGDPGRDAIAHRARSRCRPSVKPAVAVEAMHPRGKVASSVADDGVMRKHLLQMLHDRSHKHASRTCCGWRGPFKVALMKLGSPICPCGRAAWGGLRECIGEAARARIDCNRRSIDTPELFRVRVHMNELLVRIGALHQRVAGRWHLTKP